MPAEAPMNPLKEFKKFQGSILVEVFDKQCFSDKMTMKKYIGRKA